MPTVAAPSQGARKTQHEMLPLRRENALLKFSVIHMVRERKGDHKKHTGGRWPRPRRYYRGGRRYYFFLALAFAFGFAAFFLADDFFLVGNSLTSFQVLGDTNSRSPFLTLHV